MASSCVFLSSARAATGDAKTEQHSQDGYYPSADVLLWDSRGNLIKRLHGGNYVRWRGQKREKVLSDTDYGHTDAISDCVRLSDRCSFPRRPLRDSSRRVWKKNDVGRLQRFRYVPRAARLMCGSRFGV